MLFSLRFPIALVLLILCLAVPAWADFQAGMDAYNRKEYATALHEWRPLTEQGDANAQYNLGVLYSNGHGVPLDYGQARQWFEKAAALGNAKAQSSLGVLYDDGYGVSQDHRQARHWFEKAAAQGVAYAQYRLGMLYDFGNSVPQDFVQALKWYNLAAANGEKKAATLRDALAKHMTPAQIDEAHRLARDWMPKIP